MCIYGFTDEAMACFCVGYHTVECTNDKKKLVFHVSVLKFSFSWGLIYRFGKIIRLRLCEVKVEASHSLPPLCEISTKDDTAGTRAVGPHVKERERENGPIRSHRHWPPGAVLVYLIARRF